MEDFIFGTLATDELKLVYYRTSHRGLQHAYQTDPLDPLPGQPVTLTVLAGPDLAADRVACYYTLDGSQPRGSRGKAAAGQVAPFHRVREIWDTFNWGYRSIWQVQLPPQPEGTQLQYQISAWSEEGEEIYADWPDVKLTVDRTAKYFFDNQPLPDLEPWGDPHQPRTFSYHVDRFAPPRWAREAVIYHIFVDRFSPGKGKDWRQTEDLRRTFGGTLWGIVENLDHISELGATAVWLSPIFPSPTIHRYNATDYYRVAEELGGDQALRALVQEAHRRGIRVILDLVCNHISHQHPYFQESVKDPESPYRDWFYFDGEEDLGYRSFFGVEAMPQVNLEHPRARRWMLDTARYWLEEFDIDGYRLDHANGPGPGFWWDFWKVCKETKPDSICLGEVVEPPDVQRQYIGRMDGLLDFHLCEAVRRRYARGEWSQERFQSFLTRHRRYFPEDFLMATFLDNHDMDRFAFIARDEHDALRRAARLQFQLPGPPIIYYGTEVGLQQTISKTSAVGLEASRGAMIWGENQDGELFRFYQQLIQKRRETQPWKKGLDPSAG
jgi:glycosidase